MPRLLVESHQMRRIVGQLGQGDDLCQEIIAICQERRVRCASLRLSGVVEELALAHYERSSRSLGQPRTFRTPLQILSASGTISEEGGKLRLDLNLLVSRQRDNGIEVLGGVCVGGRVLSCEVIIECMDDLILRRSLERSTGLHPLSEAISASSPGSPAAAPAPPPPGATLAQNLSTVEDRPSWADAVMASVRAASEAPPVEEEEEHDEPYRPIRPGDILDHQQFGRCVVQKVDADQEFVTVRLRNSRLVRLNLEVLRLRYQGEEESHQVFVTAAKQAAD